MRARAHARQQHLRHRHARVELVWSYTVEIECMRARLDARQLHLHHRHATQEKSADNSYQPEYQSIRISLSQGTLMCNSNRVSREQLQQGPSLRFFDILYS